MTHTLYIKKYPKSNWLMFIEHNRLINIKSDKISSLNIDFTNCGFLEPFHIVLLGCLIEEYYQAGIEILFETTSNEYLNKIRFFDYWQPSFNRNNYTPCYISTTLNLWHINHFMISQYVTMAQNYFERNFFRGKDVEPLNICLSELFNNINDHSKSRISGYCLNQYYPNTRVIKMAVCDFGIGIPETVNEYLKKIGEQPLSIELALEKAFELKFSSKSMPYNQGRGLDTLKDNIKEFDGFLRVISNNSCLIIRNGKVKFYKLDYNFSGTHFDIALNTDRFDTASEEMEDFEY